MTEIPFVFEHNLIYIPVTLFHEGRSRIFPRCIVDTGSAGTAFEASLAEDVGLLPASESKIRFITSVGGNEPVYTRTVEQLRLGDELLEGKIVGNDLLQLFKVEICYKEKCLILKRYR
jgi:hypothetical protein